MPEKNAGKPADFKFGQRVLFRLRARPASWLSGTIIGGPGSRKGKVPRADRQRPGNFATLDLSPNAIRKPRSAFLGPRPAFSARAGRRERMGGAIWGVCWISSANSLILR
jgi:hypothetical protein